MSGVIDEHGVQWEHCNICTKFVRIDDLGYQKPNAIYKYGRDVCIECVRADIKTGEIAFEDLVPSRNWIISKETV